jgi:hypothetical protein
MMQYYQQTYDKLLQKILQSHVMYVDETPFHMIHETVYAWIFTNGEEVVSMYRATREGDFLKELLKDFKGVLVSDFFPIYYSMECPLKRTPSSRQKRARIKIDGYVDELKYTAAGVR